MDKPFIKGEKVVCINNSGQTSLFTIGKTYEILRCFKEQGMFVVKVTTDAHIIAGSIAARRFENLRMIRLKKLKKLGYEI